MVPNCYSGVHSKLMQSKCMKRLPYSLPLASSPSPPCGLQVISPSEFDCFASLSPHWTQWPSNFRLIPPPHLPQVPHAPLFSYLPLLLTLKCSYLKGKKIHSTSLLSSYFSERLTSDCDSVSSFVWKSAVSSLVPHDSHPTLQLWCLLIKVKPVVLYLYGWDTLDVSYPWRPTLLIYCSKWIDSWCSVPDWSWLSSLPSCSCSRSTVAYICSINHILGLQIRSL